MIIPLKAAKSFAAFGFPCHGSDFRTGMDQTIFQTLMIFFPVKMGSLLVESFAETYLPENHSVQS